MHRQINNLAETYPLWREVHQPESCNFEWPARKDSTDFNDIVTTPVLELNF